MGRGCEKGGVRAWEKKDEKNNTKNRAAGRKELWKSRGAMQVNKNILYDYIDACALVKETEEEIRELKKKRKTIIQTNVSGSNPDFPYQKQHFQIQGTTFTYSDDSNLRTREEALKKRKENAEAIKLQVEEWMITIPVRMQRIIKYKVFDGLTWQQTAKRIGRKSTENSLKKEFERFMKEN